jgi:peptidoglycan/xylan/chitin deacetylase (PgdA/CDA1 family)
MMKISVVITTYNRRLQLEQCLRSLEAQSLPASEFETIVVADGCTDGSNDFLTTYRPPYILRWLSQANLGQPAAQNAGVALAAGEIVLFLDDDCICDEKLLEAHCKAHARAERIVAIGAVLLHSKSPKGILHDVKKKQREIELRQLATEAPDPRNLMLCANTSIVRSAVLHLPFDTTYTRLHDVEAGIRLWAAGYKPFSVPEAIVYERFSKNVTEVLRDCWNQGKFEVILTRNHPAVKPISCIARAATSNPIKRTIVKGLVKHPTLGETVLCPVYWLGDRLRFFPPFAWLAKRTLAARARGAHLQGAARAAGSWKNLETAFYRRVPVIMYHNVGQPRPGEYPGLTTPTAKFTAQIRFMAKMGYTGITPREWLRWRDEAATLPERPVMLVFDDAYADASRNAFPLLEQLGWGAACMVVTGYIGATNRWDEIDTLPSQQLMSADEIRAWAKRGIEFGGHTCHHVDLRNASDEIAEQEIARCKADLTALLASEPASFAYPYGGVSAAACAAAQKHFKLAFTTWPGLLHLGVAPHLTPRIGFMPGETRIGIRIHLRWGKNPYVSLHDRCIALLDITRRKVATLSERFQ